jgi:RNA polymerase sigma factor (sigma-70 family)
MLNDVGNEIIEDNAKLVHYIIKLLSSKYNMGIFEYEELNQQGMIGLAKAAATFDKTKNNKFSTYACVCIRNSILIYMRNSTRNKLPLSGSIDDDILNTENLHKQDVMHDSFNVNNYVEIKELLEELIVLTDDLSVKTFCMSRIEGYTYGEIKTILDISLYRVRRNIARVMLAIEYIKRRDED